MKRSLQHQCKSFVMIMCLSLLVACAGGPSAEQRAEYERVAQEKRRQDIAEEARLSEERAEQNRLLLQKRSELQNSVSKFRPSVSDKLHDKDLLATLETLVRLYRQTDSYPAMEIMMQRNSMFGQASSIRNTTSPMFALDSMTGKLTMRLSAIESRELLLRHIESVDIVPNELDLNGFKAKLYAIDVFAGQDVVRKQPGSEWQN